MVAKTDAERQSNRRQRLKEQGLKEVRGAYAPEDKHPEIKRHIKEKYIEGDSED